MRRFSLTLFAVLFLAAFPAAAQQILPHSLGHWAATPNVGEPFRVSGPPSVIPIASQPVLIEYGRTSTESANYTSAAGNSDGMQASVFKMKDPSGAYGLYSFLRTPDMARADFSEHSSTSHDRALILIGNLVLDIEGQDLTRFQSEIKSLIAAARTHAQDGPLPELWQHLPERNRVEESDRYILGPHALNQLFPGNLGDSLGFSKGAEVELAHYKLGAHDAILLIADFPTPQLAAQKMGELQKEFNINGSKGGSGSPEFFAERSFTLIAVVSGASTQAEANTLLDQIQ